MVNCKPLPNCYHTMQTSTFKEHLRNFCALWSWIYLFNKLLNVLGNGVCFIIIWQTLKGLLPPHHALEEFTHLLMGGLQLHQLFHVHSLYEHTHTNQYRNYKYKLLCLDILIFPSLKLICNIHITNANASSHEVYIVFGCAHLLLCNIE